MAHSYEASKKIATKTIIILGVITIVEVILALIGKGHIGGGTPWHPTLLRTIMVVLSVVKAYLIIYEFMHLKYEVPGLVRSILLPTLLLVWAVIAFSWEGVSWLRNRQRVEKDKVEEVKDLGYESIYDDSQVFNLG